MNNNNKNDELNDKLNDKLNDNLNDDWIKDFEKRDHFFKDFYPDDLYSINNNFIYVNRSNEIEIIKKEPFFLSHPNTMKTEEIVGMVKAKSTANNKQYKLVCLFKYNITLTPENISNFIEVMKTNPQELLHDDSEYNFLKDVNHIEDVYFGKSVNMFQDLSELNFVFYERSNEMKKANSISSTKKVYLYGKDRKTKKKRYKD